MTTRKTLAVSLGFMLLAWVSAAGADNLKIGVVDLSRLVHESPQAQQAKKHMASQFAARETALEHKADLLSKEIDQLKQDSANMSDDARDKLQADIRDKQRKLQMEQSQYNDDVSRAADKEQARMRSDLHRVIDAYAKNHGYDLILGDSVLYASDTIDVTDAILARLKKQQ